MSERQIHRTQTASKVLGLMRYMNRTDFHLPGEIDEVSLLFASEGELDAYVRWAVHEAHMGNFAHVRRDEVQCLKSDWLNEDILMSDGKEVGRVAPYESFDVRFEFLRFPGADWRIEAMCVLSGSAPLHEKWLHIYGSGCVVHLSYKLDTEDSYRRHVRAGGPHVSYWPVQPTFRASYRNSYGLFAYYQHSELTYLNSEWLLKPRVNLRDSAVIASTVLEA